MSRDRSRHARSSDRSSAKEPEGVLKLLPRAAVALRAARVHHLHGHTKKVHTLAWNSSGSQLASGCMDGVARLWSVDSSGHGKETCSLKGHSDTIDQLCWHPTNHNALATASADRTVRIWDARSHKQVSSISMPGENINIEWNPNGNTLVVGNKDECLCLVDVRRTKVTKKIRFSKCEVNELAWHPSGDYLYLTKGSKDGSLDEGVVQIMQHKNNNLHPVHEIVAHSATAYCIEFDKQGRRFATGGADGTVCIFDAKEHVCVRSLDRLEYPVRSVSFSHDGEYVASGSVDHFVAVSHVDTGIRVRAIETSAPTNSVAWHPSRLCLAYACDDADTGSSSTSRRVAINVVAVK